MTVVATFPDRASAQAAVDTLARHGIASTDLHLHEKGMKPRNADGTLLDEYATGGFFTNFAHLLDDLLDTPHRSPSYEELVQFEGIAVSAQVADSDKAKAVEAWLRAAGAQKVASGTGLSAS